MRRLCSSNLLMIILLSLPVPLVAQQGPPPGVRQTVDGLLTYLETGNDAVARQLLSERGDPTWIDGFSSEDAAIQYLGTLHEAARGGTGGVDVTPAGEGLLVALENGVRIRVDLAEDGRILGLERLEDASEEATSFPAPTWDTLEGWFQELERSGFSGVVLARRGGREVLRSAYGRARRDATMENTTDLAFGIGSAPIGFTTVAALQLATQGVLDLDAPISRYLDGVPEDRSGLTPRMILQGRSGLPDFHDAPSDWDPDLAWIDRDEALARIFAAPLLFPPGTDTAHSHSAYGLLAALIEVVSGRSYEDVLRQGIFEPLGMEGTGFYGQTLGRGPEGFAEGQGISSVGAPNIPPNWGPTSWLVMGSGGMFSTLDDQVRFLDAWVSGELFPSTPGVDISPSPATVDGSDRGFFGTRVMNESGDLVLILSNAVQDVPGGERTVVRGLLDLVRGG